MTGRNPADAGFKRSIMLVAANETIRSIVLQHYRVQSALEEDERFFDHSLFRQDADYVFFAFSVWRLLEIANASAAHLRRARPERGKKLERALREFRAQVPHAVKLRHVLTHIADYAAGQGRDRKVRPGSLYSGSYQDGVRPIDGLALHLDATKAASEDLYLAVLEGLKYPD